MQLSSDERISSAHFCDRTSRPSHASCLPLFWAKFPFCVLIGSPGSPILLLLVLLPPPQKSRSRRPTTCKKGGADNAASPSILVAILICCNARNTTHVGDLYPSSSNSFVRLVSVWIIEFSTCSRTSQYYDSCFSRTFHSPLVIIQPRHGDKHIIV